MKTILIATFLSLCFFTNSAQDITVESDKTEKPPLPAPPQEILDLNGTIVYTKKEQQTTPFEQFGLVTAANIESMEGVFDMYKIPAFAPLHPDFNMDEFVMMARSSGRNLTPVVVDGTAHVRYNLQNGPIQKGDYITISNEPGVGMKATQSGFTVGVALENSDATEKSGLLKIRVMVRYEKM